MQQLKVAPGQVNLSPEDEARVAQRDRKRCARRSTVSTRTPPATLRLVQPVPGPALQFVRPAPRVQR